MLYISANNERISSEFTRVMHGNMVNSQMSMTLKYQGQTHGWLQNVP